MAHKGSEPIRKCIVCSSRRPKSSLIRMVLDVKADVIPDPAQHLPGRGAYVCAGCMSQLKRNGVVQRAFRSRARGVALEKFERLSAQ